jgi:glycerol dehydrogenase-like iron-containing ADH family enzyme
MYCDGTGLKVSSCPTLVSQDVPISANSSAVSEQFSNPVFYIAQAFARSFELLSMPSYLSIPVE